MDSEKNIISKMQKISFDILCDIDKFCKENNFTYFLSGGSCLGAVRHKGFIPWDDDIDIMMPRDDYEKFLISFNQKFKSRYGVGSILTDENWVRSAARIWDKNTIVNMKTMTEIQQGVFVDVFPIDGLPNNSFSRWLFFRKIRLLHIIRTRAIQKEYAKDEKYIPLKKFLALFMKYFDPKKLVNQINNEAKKYKFLESEYVAASLAVHYWDRETIRRECMENAVKVPFNGKKFPIPIGYDTYLKNLYGDYMKIPKDAAEKGYSHLDGWDIHFTNEGEKQQ